MNPYPVSFTLDALGNLVACLVYSVGRNCWSISRYFIVALAGCPWRSARCWTGHDPLTGIPHWCPPIIDGNTENWNRHYPAFMFAPPSLSPRSLAQSVSWLLAQLHRIALDLVRSSQMQRSGISPTDWKVSWPVSFKCAHLNGYSNVGSPMALPLFWIALICQLIIVLGYFWFYRKEQLGV